MDFFLFFLIIDRPEDLFFKYFDLYKLVAIWLTVIIHKCELSICDNVGDEKTTHLIEASQNEESHNNENPIGLFKVEPSLANNVLISIKPQTMFNLPGKHLINEITTTGQTMLLNTKITYRMSIFCGQFFFSTTNIKLLDYLPPF